MVATTGPLDIPPQEARIYTTQPQSGYPTDLMDGQTECIFLSMHDKALLLDAPGFPQPMPRPHTQGGHTIKRIPRKGLGKPAQNPLFPPSLLPPAMEETTSRPRAREDTISSSISFRQIQPTQTIPLRHSVLWPDAPISHVLLPEDDLGWHYGAFLPTTHGTGIPAAIESPGGSGGNAEEETLAAVNPKKELKYLLECFDSANLLVMSSIKDVELDRDYSSTRRQMLVHVSSPPSHRRLNYRGAVE
ncbi:hypothetical protein ONZ45_g1169 [Pleurotus djamor]|nr:hypothetical protein ONZ45_g1169 [Pleurotus djamor]